MRYTLYKSEIEEVLLYVFFGLIIMLLPSCSLIQDDKALAPTELLPRNNSDSFYTFPNFSWKEDPNQFKEIDKPVQYEIQVATDHSFQKIIDQDTVYLSRYVHAHPFQIGTYFWRVRTYVTEKMKTPWSNISSFTIKPYEEVVTIDYQDGGNNTLKVLAAIEKVKELVKGGKSVQLVFPTGDYYVEGTTEDYFYLIDLESLKNVSIKGDGATIHLSHRKHSFFRAENCEFISVQGFKTRYKKNILRVRGRIERTVPDKRRLIVRLDKDSPDFNGSDLIARDILLQLDPKINGKLKNLTSSFYRIKEDFEKNKDGTYTINLAKGGVFERWKKGDRFVYHFREGSPNGLVEVGGSRQVTAYDLYIWGWANMGFVSRHGTGSHFSILNCKTNLKEVEWMMGNADGIHVRGHEVGPWVEDVHIQGIGDDGIAFYARPAKMSIDKNNQYKSPKHAFCLKEHFNFDVDNHISFFNPLTGEILVETVVQEIMPVKQGYWVKFKDTLPHSRFNIEEPNLLKATQLWNRSKSCGDFVVRNSTLKNIRRHGTVFRAKRGVVEKMKYINTSSIAVSFLNETAWPNGLYASEIIISNNEFTHSSYSNPGTSTTIDFRFTARGQTPESIGPKNILIQNNIFYDCPSPEIGFQGAENVALINNKVKKGWEIYNATHRENRSENIKTY